MLKFVTISNYLDNQGQILSCNGQLLVTKTANKQIVLCSNQTTSSQEIAYRNENPIGYLPTGAQSNMYSSVEANPDRAKTYMYATLPESIGGLVANAQILATSKSEPLILYYLYTNKQLSLYLYNIKTRSTTQISSFAISNIDSIASCQFLIGGFATPKQQDIFASCNILNITNAFFNQIDNYQQVDKGLGSWCSTDNNVSSNGNSNQSGNNIATNNNIVTNANNIIMLGDFNGDKLSDLFCLGLRQAMINKVNSFRGLNLLQNLPGNWQSQLNSANSQNNIALKVAIGDFDGNGVSDFISLNNNGNIEVLFNNKLNQFITYPGNQNTDGSYVINGLPNWCSTNSNGVVAVIDADNDGKDDLLCQIPQQNTANQNITGNVYLSLCRTDPLVLPANQTIKRVVVTLGDYVIGDNIGYYISEETAPLFCDASRTYEYFTKTSCSLNSQNRVKAFTNPTRQSGAIPALVVNSHIKGSIYLGDADKFGEINTVNEQVLDELTSFQGKKLTQSKIFKLESKNFVDPSREFDTTITMHYIRQGKGKDKKHHAVNQAYSHSVHGGDCNEVHFSYITLTNQFIAQGRIEAYDQNDNQIMDRNILSDLANLYILSGNATTALGTKATTIINTIAGGIVSFSFSGELSLQTLYQKNVTQCSIKGITQSDITNNDLKTTTVGNPSLTPMIQTPNSPVCLMEPETPPQYINTTESGSTSGPSLLSRNDVLELDGIIYAGASFFPDVISNATKSGNLGVDRYGTNLNDISCQLNYNNSITLNAYLKNSDSSSSSISSTNNKYFTQKPNNELMIDFRQNGIPIYEPTRIRNQDGTASSTPAALYAGFDNIKLIKLVAFDPTHVLIAWTIYLPKEQQYYLLIDYANTGGNLLRIPLYEQNFNITITNQRLGHMFYVSYRKTPDKLVISQYIAESFALLQSIEVGVDDVSENNEGDSQFIVQVEEIPASITNVTTINGTDTNSTTTTTETTGPTSNLVVIRSHRDTKGLFVKKFDIYLNEVGTESNIICDDSQSQISTINQNVAAIPTKIDDGYDVLRLNYKHNSKIVYHSSDRTNNLNKKISLQNGLNLLYRGLNYLKTTNAKAPQDNAIGSQIKTALEGLVCSKTTLSYSYLNTAIQSMKLLLQSDLTFEIHDDTSNSKCQTVASNYPIYRVGNVVHLCPNFDILNNMNECNRLITLADITKNLMTPSTPTVDGNVLLNMLGYFPSDVIAGYTQIINSGSTSTDTTGTNTNNIYTSTTTNTAICDTGSSYTPPQTQTSQAASNVANAPANNYANNIVNSLVAGLLSTTDTQSPQPVMIFTTENTAYNNCFGMVIRDCSASYDRQYNNLCMSYFFESAATASIVEEAARSNINPRLNCQTGCDLDNPALAKLASSAGGYITTKIDRSFMPKDYSYIFARAGITLNYTTIYPVYNAQILTAAPTYFYQDQEGASLIAFAYLGNDYIDLTAQYFMLNSTTALGSEQFLGRFLNVRQIQTVAFNEGNVLIGYSVKHPTESNYNILVQYITPISTRVVNIYPSYNGAFALDIVPTTNIEASTATSATSEFMIAYTSSDTGITSKHYIVTANSITEQLQVIATVAQAGQVPTSALNANITVPVLSVNAFLDNTFNVIWSYLDQTGIQVQRYNLQTGAAIGSTETIQNSTNLQYPETVKVGAGEQGKTIISWQNQDQVYLSMINQTPSQQTGLSGQTASPTISFAANNFTLQTANIVDEIKNIVSLALKDLNNNLKQVVVNANSTGFTQNDVLYENGGILSLGNNTATNITSSSNAASSTDNSGSTNSNTNINQNNANYLFDQLLGTITKSLNITSNNQQCPNINTNTDNTEGTNSNAGTNNNGNSNNDVNDILNNLNIEDIVSEAQDLLQDKGKLIDQIQAALNIPQVKQSLAQLGIKEDVVYSLIEQLNSIADLENFIKNNLNPFQNFNISQVPDTDITSQIKSGQDFATAIANAFSTSSPSATINGQRRNFNAENFAGLLNTLSSIPFPTDLSEDGIIEYLSVEFKNIMTELIRTLLQPIFDQLQGQNNDRHFEATASNVDIVMYVLVALLLCALVGLIVCKRNQNCIAVFLGVTLLFGVISVIFAFRSVDQREPVPVPPAPAPLPLTSTLVKNCIKNSPPAESSCSAIVYSTVGTCWMPIGNETGGNPTIRLKQQLNGAVLAIGKSITYSKSWESVAAFGASYIFQNNQAFAQYKTLMPNIQVIAPSFVTTIENSCNNTSPKQQTNYQVASSFIENKSIRKIITQKCPKLSQNQYSCKVLYPVFAAFDADSVADYVFSQFLLGGGDFQETNIAVKTIGNVQKLFKLDLDVSFQKGKFKGTTQAKRTSCNDIMDDVIYDPKTIGITWAKFKEVLVYDANLIFLSPKRCQWSIDNNGVIGFHSDTGAMQTAGDFTYGNNLNKQPQCRQDIITAIRNNSPLNDITLTGTEDEISYCKLIVSVMQKLDNHKSSLNCEVLTASQDPFVNVQGVALYYKNELISSSTPSCLPDDFANGLSTWLTGQCNAIKNMT